MRDQIATAFLEEIRKIATEPPGMTMLNLPPRFSSGPRSRPPRKKSERGDLRISMGETLKNIGLKRTGERVESSGRRAKAEHAEVQAAVEKQKKLNKLQAKREAAVFPRRRRMPPYRGRNPKF